MISAGQLFRGDNASGYINAILANADGLKSGTGGVL